MVTVFNVYIGQWCPSASIESNIVLSLNANLRNRIASIDLVNLSESTKAAFPLMKPALESLAAQIYQSQSLENITYPDDQK